MSETISEDAVILHLSGLFNTICITNRYNNLGNTLGVFFLFTLNFLVFALKELHVQCRLFFKIKNIKSNLIKLHCSLLLLYLYLI